jgi:hypothetical protein
MSAAGSSSTLIGCRFLKAKRPELCTVSNHSLRTSRCSVQRLRHGPAGSPSPEAASGSGAAPDSRVPRPSRASSLRVVRMANDKKRASTSRTSGSDLPTVRPAHAVCRRGGAVELGALTRTDAFVHRVRAHTDASQSRQSDSIAGTTTTVFRPSTEVAPSPSDCTQTKPIGRVA